MATSKLSETPTLSESHSGIPQRLLQKATYAKSLIYDGKSAPDTVPLKRGLAVPQGISKTAFLSAIDELATLIGAANVQLNDKQIKNGWYEFPQRHLNAT